MSVSELPAPLRAGSFDEWWARTSSLAGPLAKVLASLPEDARRPFATAREKRSGPMRRPTGWSSPG